ncbi:Uncharacterized protein TPAR_07683 [Tolypocladium paradoxum]|uniref:Major facilitator superfamily (MFS) profile domain-containing protein n=1 Tax=Tolypocladium paradoxum TaxID=94208 RepID=A0A2S4KPJ2_9HYPO|nr:Uncharacterized protein TPAR_07683 [Tolypocladium paradoxum]
MDQKESQNPAANQVEDANGTPAETSRYAVHDNAGSRGILLSPYVLGAAALASCGGSSFGYVTITDQGVISIVPIMKQFHQTFPETAPGSPSYGFHTGFMTGMLEFGAFIDTDESVRQEWEGAEVRFLKTQMGEQQSTNHFTSEILQWIDLFRPRYIKRTIVALGIPFFQQFSGINAFVYYAPTLFAALGQKGDMPLKLSGLVNICQLIAGVPTLIFLDRIGLRPLAIAGGFAMTVPHIIMAGIVGKFGSSWDAHPAMGWLGVALIYVYVLCYASSYGPLAWCLPAEVFPVSKRAKGVGAATAMVWLANFIIGVVVPEMVIELGWGTYLFFGVFCLAAGVFSFFFVPDVG